MATAPVANIRSICGAVFFAVSAALLADLNPLELAWIFIKARVRDEAPRDDGHRQSAITDAAKQLRLRRQLLGSDTAD
ncbi:MAG: hypothetical protein KY445_16050 [Armatimonadetes bacterium]|nr:hypothetical protein [Armatimonadota bacterium]